MWFEPSPSSLGAPTPSTGELFDGATPPDYRRATTSSWFSVGSLAHPQSRELLAAPRYRVLALLGEPDSEFVEDL